jgi:hypothetical protein
MNAFRKSLGYRLASLAGKKKENCNGVLSLSNDLIESVLAVKQDTTTNNISYQLEKDVLDDMLKDDEKKSPCDKIREEYIPNIISNRQINLDAYINFLKHVKKKYYEFNISVLKVIYSRLEIEENKKKYTYDDFKELYDDFNKGNADKIKIKYKKQYDSLSRIYKQSIKIYDKLKQNVDIKKKCERDIEIFERKLKRLNYFLDSLKNIYNQLYSENYITTNEEGGNPEFKKNERIQNKREKIVNSEFKERQEAIGGSVKYQINIQTGDIPHYYTFSEDLSIAAKKNKQKAWDEFINNLGVWLDNEEFGLKEGYDNKTISENYEKLLSKGNKTEKALYYLVFKINELWKNKSDEDKQQFKAKIESGKEKPNEEESVSSTTPTLKRVLLEIKKSLNDKLEKGEINDDDDENKILKLLTFLNIQSRNPNIQNILKDNVFNEKSPKPYLYEGLGELNKLLESKITSMNDIYDNVPNQEQEDKSYNTGSKKKETKEKDPRINRELVTNLQKKLEERGGIIEAGTGLSEEQKEEFKKKEKKEKNQSQASKKWKFYTEYEERDFFETPKKNKYGTLRRKSRVILKKRKSSRRIKNRRSTLRKR